MGKLTAQQREIVGSNCVAASVKNNNSKQVVVYTTDKNAGLAVKGILAAAYPSYKFYKAENRAANTVGQVLFGIFTWGAGNAVQAAAQTWKNFTVETSSKKEASDLVTEIEDCILEQGGSYVPDPEGPPYTYVYGTGNGNGNNPKDSNTTTYIIIGAAAVIILLLLWDKKRK